MGKIKSEKKNGVFSGILWSFGERISAQLVSLIVTIVLARMLEPDQYTLVAIVTIFITIANSFVTGGFGNALIQKKDADSLDFSSVFWASTGVSIIFYFVIFAVSPYIARFYHMDALSPIFRVMSLRLIIASVNSVQHAYVSKQMAFKKFFISTLFGTAISGIVGVVLAYRGFGVWALVAQYLTNTTIDTVVLAFTCGWVPQFRFSVRRVKTLFSYGWKILVSEILATVYEELCGIALSKGFRPNDLSYYNQGRKYPELFNNNIEVSLNKVLLQKLSDEQDDLIKVREITSKTVQTISFLMFPIFFGLATCGETLIRLVLTEKWLPCVPFLRISCMIYLITPLNNANTRAFKAIGRSGIFLIITIFRYAVGSILLFSTWIFFRNPYLVILSGFIALVLMWVFCALVSGRLFGYSVIRQIKDFSKPLVASVIMYFSVYAISGLPINQVLLLMIEVLSGVAIYVIVSWLINRNVLFEIKDYIFGLLKK